MPQPGADGAAEADAAAWARSGAMALTGPADAAGLGPPAPLVPRLAAIADVLHARSAGLGSPVRVDPLVLLTERAALAGLTRRGQTSCGGGTRLLPTADRWLAVSLARPEDVELVPAWLGLHSAPDDPWAVVAEQVERRPSGSLADQGRLVGLPLGVLPDEPGGAPRPPPPPAALPVRSTRLGEHRPAPTLAGLVVADLGSLWAGPLCGSLLADAGATVFKVESTRRPDGARRGPPAFFDLLNAGKRSVALDLADAGGRQALKRLLARVDVVIEASRPRALEQLGIDAHEMVRTARPRVWLSITAHGRDADHRDLVGFGDDTAVAGGLVSWADGLPCFCADAVADPVTGLVGATAVLEALTTGGRWLLDIALSRAAAHLAGRTLTVPAGAPIARPSPRPPRGAAPALGAHTEEVLAELATGP